MPDDAYPTKAATGRAVWPNTPITEAEIAAMTKGSDLKISVQNQNQQPAFTVTVPVTGFAAAYAKVK